MKIIEKVFNIADHERPRTIYAWTLLFLHRLGLIIGVTTLTAMFVTQFGINNLPFMVLAQAALTIAGMFAFSFLNEHFSSKQLIPICAFAVGLILFISTFFVDQPYVFFSLLLSVTGIFLPQLTIFLGNYVEDFFTPLECERTFPVIESAQTIGGIFAGLLITTLSVYIGSYKFFYLWILLLFLGVSVIFFLEPFSPEHHHIFQKQEKIKRSLRSKIKKFGTSIKEIQLVPFLQGLLIIFLLHWVVAQVLEFQYTKMIDESISSSGSALVHEANLAYGLGSFQILFHASALIVQLLVASRILQKIGTVGSFLLHSLVTFFSTVSLLLGFGYFTVILAKNNFELSGIVHYNAYEASYYALRHGTQRQVREFFEAFVFPAATIFGTLIVLAVQFFFLPEHSYIALEAILLLLTIGMIVFSLRLQGSYTKLSKENLLKAEHSVAKFHAIEILSQKGHQDHLPALIQALKNPRESRQVKLKILQIFYKISDAKTIPVLIDFLNSADEELALAAVHALGTFTTLGENVFDQAFSRYRVINELKDLFERNLGERMRESIIRTLAGLRYEKIVPFLLKAMKGSSEQFQVACIQVFDLFHDPSIVEYLLPFLKSPSPFVRAQVVAALWQFQAYRNRLRSILNELFHSTKREDFLAYCSVIGDIGNIDDQKKLLSRFTVLDPVLKVSIAFALFKLGYEDAVSDLVHLLFTRNSLVLSKVKDFFRSLKPEQKRFLQNMLRREVSQKLQPFFSKKESAPLSSDSESVLQFCKEAYISLDLHEETEHLFSFLEPEQRQLYAF